MCSHMFWFGLTHRFAVPPPQRGGYKSAIVAPINNNLYDCSIKVLYHTSYKKSSTHAQINQEFAFFSSVMKNAKSLAFSAEA